MTLTPSPTASPSVSPSRTGTPTWTPPATATATPSVSPSASASPTQTPAPAQIGGVYESGGGSGYVYTGLGTPGDTVYVTINGVQVGGSTVVEPDGSWTLGPVGPAPGTGDVVQAHSGSPTGPSNGFTTVIAPGGAATAVVTQPNVDGGATVITVSGNPGETVVIVNQSTGEVLGSAVVQLNGQVAVALDTPVLPGDALLVLSNGIQEDTVVIGAPGQPALVIQGAVLTEGSTLTGTGIPGSTIQVVDDQGRVLGSAIVAPDGSWVLAVSGAVAGVGVKVIQDGVETRLGQPALKLGEEKLFISKNVFRPQQGGSLDLGFKATVDEKVTVKIFNLAGETVRLVAEIEVRAGVLYALRWSGQNDAGETVAAGVYIISVYGPNTRILKKVVVLK